MFVAFALVGVPLIGLVAVEGVSSWGLFAFDLARDRWVQAARPVETYDSLLGWVNRPQVYIRDMYGPGIYFQSNGQGFRNATDILPHVAPDQLRIVCSGDSFTLGQGVDNDHAWCALLASLDPRLKPVNLGEAGYGFDQAYLRYRRDARALDHAFHILAFITDDFRRMEVKGYWFWVKPRLAIRDGKLVTENVPVHRLLSKFGLLATVLGGALRLRSYELLTRAAQRLGHETQRDSLGADSSTAQVVSLIIEDLAAMGRDRGIVQVLVHLPVSEDYFGHGSDAWSRRVRLAAERAGVSFIDLNDDFRQLAPDSVSPLFIPWGTGSAHYPESGGHYSAAGNAWVARVLYRRLSERRETGRRLGTPP